MKLSPWIIQSLGNKNMFGFGKKKEGMHIFFLQTVAASHSMRKTFCSIWNSYRHIANLEPLPPGDKEVIKFFDMYNKLYTSNLLNEFNIASRSNPQIQTLPFLMYFSSMQDAINEEPSEHETDEIKNFLSTRKKTFICAVPHSDSLFDIEYHSKYFPGQLLSRS